MYLQWGHGDKVQKARKKVLVFTWFGFRVVTNGGRGDNVDGGQGRYVLSFLRDGTKGHITVNFCTAVKMFLMSVRQC